jgi:hemolysin activation/secretion protein
MGSVQRRLACLLACVCALVSLRAGAQPQPPRLRLDTEALELPPPPPAAQATPTAGEPAAETPPETTAETPAEAPETTPPARTDEACQRVVNIRFMGLRRVNAEDLQQSIRVRTGECLDRARASRDARTLWDLGFFRDVRVGVERAEGGVEVRYRVSERPTVHAVRFEGYDDVDEDKLRETIDIRDGSVLSESAVRRNVQKLLDLYEEKGFFLARVTHPSSPGPATATRWTSCSASSRARRCRCGASSSSAITASRTPSSAA